MIQDLEDEVGDIMTKFIDENRPYYIKSKDHTENTPINTMDCIRILDKL